MMVMVMMIFVENNNNNTRTSNMQDVRKIQENISYSVTLCELWDERERERKRERERDFMTLVLHAQFLSHPESILCHTGSSCRHRCPFAAWSRYSAMVA